MNILLSIWYLTAFAKVIDSKSLPINSKSLGDFEWSTLSTLCSMIGPSSRSEET